MLAMKIKIIALLLCVLSPVLVFADDIKLGATTEVPMFIKSDAGPKVTGADFTDAITIYWRCFGETTTAINETGDTLVEVRPGYYELTTNDTITCAAGKVLFVWMEGDVGVYTVDPAFTKFSVVANVEADSYERLGAPAGASVSADVAAVKADTEKNNYTVFNVLDLTNDGGDQNPTDTIFDTDLPFTNNIVASEFSFIKFPPQSDLPAQDANCNVAGETAYISSYNTTSKVVTLANALSAAPDYRCKFVKD